MNKSQAKKSPRKKILAFIDNHMTAIIIAILFGGLGIIILWTLCGKQIIAFFSPTPQHKCEASLPSYASNIYCKEDGTQGNKKQDECKEKSPDYIWVADEKNAGECKKVDTFKNSKKQINIDKNKGYTCTDVTSYDYNWENDMYCTAPDGSHFYTSYEDAELLTRPDPYEQLLEQYDGYENYDGYDYYDY